MTFCAAVCYKPTSRLAQFASLGIPVVTYPFASYIDILVEFGYPLVAESLDEVRHGMASSHGHIGTPTRLHTSAARATMQATLQLDLPAGSTGNVLSPTELAWTGTQLSAQKVSGALQAAAMLDQLRASPELRQEASRKLLEISRFLSVDELSEHYEQVGCRKGRGAAPSSAQGSDWMSSVPHSLLFVDELSGDHEWVSWGWPVTSDMLFTSPPSSTALQWLPGVCEIKLGFLIHSQRS